MENVGSVRVKQRGDAGDKSPLIRTVDK
jgi:hypothetical protein